MRWMWQRRGLGIGAVATVLALAACGTHAPTESPSAPRPTTTGATGSPVSTAAVTPTPGGPTTTAARPDILGPCRDKAKGLTNRQRALQVVMMGVSPTGVSGQASTLVSEGIGGVFYTSRSGASQSAVAATSESIQKSAPLKLLISVDQEGGMVQGLAGSGFAKIPSASSQAKQTPAATQANWATWGAQLWDAGINVNLAPVADVVTAGSEAANPPVGALERGYGSDPTAVTAQVGAALDGMAAGRVSGTLKHFPNLGRVSVNTDFGSATDFVTTLDDPALETFYANLPKTGMVMTSLATYPKIDGKSIASFSPTVHQALRDHGFTGVIISDDMGGAVAVQSLPVGQRAVRFLTAGGDMALAVSPETAGEMVDAVEAAAAKDPAFAALLQEHVVRVLAYKEKLTVYRCA